MAIDIHSERIVPIGKAPKHIPGRPNLSSIYRWISKGIRGARLETVTVGGRRYTSLEAIEKFIAETTANSAGSGNPVPKPTTRQSEARLRRAERDLDAAGI